jgi:hypothetical protein
MTNKETAASIKRIAKAYRRDHKRYMPNYVMLIYIHHLLPYVSVDLPNGKSYFFQGEDAGGLIEDATTTSNKFNVPLEDAMLWMASSWG